MSYTKLYSIISKPWIDTNEICILCNCSLCNAIKIRKEVEVKVKEMGKRIPISTHKVVPTKVALDYLCIDEEYVYQMACKENELNKKGVLYER